MHNNLSKPAFKLLLFFLSEYKKSGMEKVRFYPEEYINLDYPDLSIKELEKYGYVVDEGNIAGSVILTKVAFSEMENILNQRKD